MTTIQERAIEKLENEKNLTGGGRVAKAIARETAKALQEFCRQSVDFATAVYDGGSFEECCEAVSQGVGSSISDFEIYRKAVQHYLPNADIKFCMEIHVGEAAKAEPENVIHFNFDLANFM